MTRFRCGRMWLIVCGPHMMPRPQRTDRRVLGVRHGFPTGWWNPCYRRLDPGRLVPAGIRAEEFAAMPHNPRFTAATAGVDVPASGRARAVGLPVSIGKPDLLPSQRNPNASGGAEPPTFADPPGRVDVETFDTADAEQLPGVSGLAFQVHRRDNRPGASQVQVGVDYSAWVAAFGVEWATRVSRANVVSSVVASESPRGWPCWVGR